MSEMEDAEAPSQGGEEAHDEVHSLLLLSSLPWRMWPTPPLLLVMEEAAYSLPSIMYRRARSKTRN